MAAQARDEAANCGGLTKPASVERTLRQPAVIFGAAAEQVSAGAGLSRSAGIEDLTQKIIRWRPAATYRMRWRPRVAGPSTVYAGSRGEPNTKCFAHRNGAVIRQLVDFS